MASKGPRSKLDHETRARRHKALEAPREPPRPRTHWDHVLEEMVWLSKDFESERKWKLAQAKKVVFRASKGLLDHASRGEKKLKEEEQRLRKVATNISKDVKKFWVKIEKLVLYKHQMELDEKKKKALDKQLEFLLGQTERYSTMLAENLVDKQDQSCELDQRNCKREEMGDHEVKGDGFIAVGLHSDAMDEDDDYCKQSDEQSEDDEHTIEEDEALITKKERQEELVALHDEAHLPLVELLKRYCQDKAVGDIEHTPEKGLERSEVALDMEDHCLGKDQSDVNKMEQMAALPTNSGRRCDENDDINRSKSERCINSALSTTQGDLVNVGGIGYVSTISKETTKDPLPCDLNDEQEDADFVLTMEDEKDDEATLSEEEKLAEADPDDPEDEIQLLQKETEIPLEELLARYKKESNGEVSGDDMDDASALSEDFMDSDDHEDIELNKHESLSENAESGLCPRLDGQDAETEATSDEQESENRIADAAAAARSAQPTGNTFSTTKVRTKFPFLLKYPLREYQHIGLDWLVTMYEQRLNGILADEMGLGKTIMTIALLAHLACEKGIWGPHLIVVPTSVMLNWETEFLKWCPAFKILTYFGSAKERKLKRQGWLKPNFFHVCITTYRLVIQDAKIFKRKKWKYLILDEAHLIKNWKSQRWQTLLNFNSKRRILLTGTPLQNDLMELWSLMHFLMPHIFQSHQEFKDWFSNPISGMVEGQERVNKEVVDRLHNVLRPFILRRLKRDVEKQLPMKHEHVIYCRLSRRQRNLYEDFISSSETQATLASSNFFGMISVIMQLRKVCNHPDLFEGRPIISSFDMAGIDAQLSSSICSVLSSGPFSTVDLSDLGLIFTHLDYDMTSWEHAEVADLATPSTLIKEGAKLDSLEVMKTGFNHQKLSGTSIFEQVRKAILDERLREVKERAASVAWWNSLRCHRKPIYSSNLRKLVTVQRPVDEIHAQKVDQRTYMFSSKLADIILSPVERFQALIDLVESFMFAIPAARAPEPTCWCSTQAASVFLHPTYKEKCSEVLLPLLAPIRPAIVRWQVYFPDRRLVQFDCGKLQELAVLLRKLKSEGHRALIFTQMTKMLDILEAFINLYGYTYMRLDGSTQPEERQTLMQRFNTNPKIFLFILSTRSGGVGINLVGADTVIFYDSDWNPAMDQQAQDRCHRIGQTREVHIYRLISESTIEENILRKAKQKRALDDLVIQSGSYNTEFFKKLDPMELFSGHESLPIKDVQETCVNNEDEMIVSSAEVEAALKYAEDEADYMALKRVEQEAAVVNQEFTEDAMGRLEDDECVNDDDTKVDEPADQEITTVNMDSLSNLNRNESIEDRVLKFAGSEDDADMLADVREIAEAAAAAGQAISSFENQLRPIDRYAIRFLELWDPVIDKTSIDSHDGFEETEWELERIEKYKEEIEADIDDDEEPFVYERWDADFATKAYREQVEALAQHQLEEDLLAEANAKEDEDGLANDAMAATPKRCKPKSKKKPKKAKFKSLKKGSLASEIKHVKEEPSAETVSFDDGGISDGTTSLEMMPLSTVDKKRKKGSLAVDAEADKNTKKKFKKLKKAQEASRFNVDRDHSEKRHDDHAEIRSCDRRVPHLELKPFGRSKMGGKVSITSMPVKRILTIKPEKFKKGNIWSRDCVPSPDIWLPQEDAILCAVVHEYGPNWNLVCETLYGLTAGGAYQGRYRHPVHCCERYRELIQRFVLSSPENQISEKVSSLGSGKGLLKVTEENIRTLLNIAAGQPDHELLLQKHFTALLTSVWRVTSHVDHRKNALSQNLPLLSERFARSLDQTSRSCKEELVKRTRFNNSGESKKLLTAALDEANSFQSEYAINHKKSEDAISLPNQREDVPSVVDRLEVTLEFLNVEGDDLLPLPQAISMFIPGFDSSTSSSENVEEEHLKSSTSLEEIRFRERVAVEGSSGVASPPLYMDDVKLRPHAKLQSLGKHKLPLSDSTKPPKRLKRSSLEADGVHRSNAWPVIQSLPTVSSEEPSLGSGSIDFHDKWTDCTDSNGIPSLDGELHSEMAKFEDVPHQYIPGLISGLDDYEIWPEFTDVG